MKKLIGMVIAILLCTPLAGEAATRLVSPSGVDVGDCIALPCLTITYAVGQAVDGDGVNVAAGTYSEEATVSKKLSIVGAGNDATIIDIAPGRYAFVIEDGSSDITISGFRFEGNANSAAPQEGGVLIEAPDLGVSNVTVTRNTFFGLDNGFESRGELSNIVVSENLFEKLTDWSAIEVTTLSMGSGLPYTVDGVRISGNEIRYSLTVPVKLSNYSRASGSVMRNLNVTGNFIHDNNGQAPHMENWTGGIALRHGATNVTVTGNEIRDNLNLSGINIAGAGTYDELTITQNYLSGNIGCDRSPFLATEHAAGIKFRSITGPVTYTIENNAIVGNDEGATNNGAAVLKMWNNYWGCNGGPAAAGCDVVLGALDASPWLSKAAALSINIDPLSKSLLVSQKLNLVITASRVGGETPDITSECRFESSNESVAGVDDAGLVTAIAPGRATIDAECTDQGATFTANAVIDVTEVNAGAVDVGGETGDETDTPAGSSTREGGNSEDDEFASYRMGGGCSSQIVPSSMPQGWMLAVLTGLGILAMAVLSQLVAVIFKPTIPIKIRAIKRILKSV